MPVLSESMEPPWQDLSHLSSPSYANIGVEGSLPDLTRAIIDGSGPFAPSQCHRLFENACAAVSVDKRLDSLGSAFDESRKANAKFDGMLATILEKVRDLRADIESERRSQEEKNTGFKVQLALATENTQQEHNVLATRIDEIAIRIGASTDAHTQTLATVHEKIESVMAKHHAGQDHALREKTAWDTLHQGHVTLQDRINFVEGLLGESMDKQSKAVDLAHSKIEQVHDRVLHERDALQNSLSGYVGQHRTSFEEHATVHSVIMKRLEEVARYTGDSFGRQAELERCMKESFDRHLEEVGSLKAAHANDIGALKAAHAEHVDAVGKAHQIHKATMEERLSFVEKMIGDSAERHAEVQVNVDKVHEFVGDQTKNTDVQWSNMYDQFAKEQDARTAIHGLHNSLKQRVDYLENILGESADKHAEQLAIAQENMNNLHAKVTELGSLNGEQLANAHETLENLKEILQQQQNDGAAHQDALAERFAKEQDARSNHAANVAERISYLESVVGDSAGKHNQENQKLHAKIEVLQEHLATHAEHGTSIERLKQAHAISAQETSLMQASHGSIAERLESLENSVGNSKNRLEMLHNKVADIGSVKDTRQDTLHSLMSRDIEARELHQSTVQERLTYLEDLIGESANKHSQEMQTQHTALHNRVGVFEQKLGDEISGLRDHVHGHTNGEKNIRIQHHGDVAELLENERNARQAFELFVRQRLAEEVDAREIHEVAVHEQLSLEQQARDRHHEHVQQFFARERSLRENDVLSLQDHLAREKSAREMCNKELHAVLAKKKISQGEKPRVPQQDELLKLERAARRDSVDESRLVQNLERLTQTPLAVFQRMDMIQQSIAVVDGLVRQESQERAAETKELWNIIEKQSRSDSPSTRTQEPELPERRGRVKSVERAVQAGSKIENETAKTAAAALTTPTTVATTRTILSPFSFDPTAMSLWPSLPQQTVVAPAQRAPAVTATLRAPAAVCYSPPVAAATQIAALASAHSHVTSADGVSCEPLAAQFPVGGSSRYFVEFPRIADATFG